MPYQFRHFPAPKRIKEIGLVKQVQTALLELGVGYTVRLDRGDEVMDDDLTILYHAKATDYTIQLCGDNSFLVNHWDEKDEAMEHLYCGPDFTLAVWTLVRHMKTHGG